MRREGFLCFGFRTSQNTLDLLDFDHKKIKIKEIEMGYINFFEKNKIIFSYMQVGCILPCYNTATPQRGGESMKETVERRM